VGVENWQRYQSDATELTAAIVHINAVPIVITIKSTEDADINKFAGGFSLDSGHW